MHKGLLAACAALTISIPATAGAAFVTGNSLLADFKSTDGFGPAYAHGYSVGVFDSFEGVNHCAPIGVSQGQIRAIARRYLESNPETLHHPAQMLLKIAYKNAFPCSNE